MIQTKSVNSPVLLSQWMNSLGLTMADIVVAVDASGALVVIYDDGSDRDIILPSDSAGVSFSSLADDDFEVQAEYMFELGARRTAVAGEDFGDQAGEAQVADTLAETYVIPGSVVFSDSGTAPDMKDDRRGRIVHAETGQNRGSIDYATGDFVINYGPRERPTGTVTADYEYSDVPDAGEVADTVRCWSMVVELLDDAGGTVTEFNYALYETSDKSFGAVSSSSAAVPVTEATPALVDLDGLVSSILDITTRGARWVNIIPNAVGGKFRVRFTWDNVAT